MKIEGLPEGIICHSVKVVELDSGDSEQLIYNARVIAKRVKPRRIVLEETGEVRITPMLNRYNYFYTDSEGFDKFRIMREVKGSDLSLHNDDDKESLRLSVDECKAIITSNVYANPIIIDKLRNFIKDSK